MNIFEQQAQDARTKDIMDAVRAEMYRNKLEVQISELRDQNKRMLEVIERQTQTILNLSERIGMQTPKESSK